MAFVRESVGAGGQSGIIGDVVMVQTQSGTIMRSRPRGSHNRTPAQVAQGRRLELARFAWELLGDEEVAAWRTYALEQAAASPRNSRKRMTSGWSAFSGLASKYLQVHGGRTVPSLPPVGRFLGDALEVSVATSENPTPSAWGVTPGEFGSYSLSSPPSADPPPQGEGYSLAFSADGANRPGVLTEIKAQPLRSRHNLPNPNSYVTIGFIAFETGVPVELPMNLPGTWACAVRFVEAATGRMTELVPIGKATIGSP
jgi:hypothetical protein